MTGYASLKGEGQGHSWTWDLRSVNAKGLDLRLRVPDWIEGLEPAVRGALSKGMARGSVNLSLRVNRDGETGALAVNAAQLEAVLSALQAVEERAMDKGISLAPSKASDLLSQRGVMEQAVEETDSKALLAAITAQLPELLASFKQMRASEGQALEA
ncbi:MAG: YicC/YloC family endoribonuclease, partial [Pseudomonadota bacterium]|nr:YicC/YloC family endoribonuclease [Pseudomonadota bacterium]